MIKIIIVIIIIMMIMQGNNNNKRYGNDKDKGSKDIGNIKDDDNSNEW